MSPLRMCLLGGLSIEQGGRELRAPTGKKYALFCYLAITGKQHTRSRLAGLLWSDFPEPRARGNLRDALGSLRRSSLAPYVDIGRHAISFNAELPHRLDTTEFETLSSHLEAAHIVDVEPLESALALYKGELMAGLQLSRAALFEEWIMTARQRYHLLAVRAYQRLVDYHLDSGNYETGITYANQLLDLDRWREDSHRNLMLLQMLTGRFDVALRQYESCRKALVNELGVEPSGETQALYHSIRRQQNGRGMAPGLELGPQISTKPAAICHNAPVEMTPYFGRKREGRAIVNVFSDPTARLVTVLGVGGSGKTRLATAIGQKQAEAIERDGSSRFPDGVFFVSLEAAESTSEILPAICDSLDFRPQGERLASRSTESQLIEFLRHKRMLLILDNFEQLIDGAGLLSNVLRVAPNVFLLVTSRQRLGLQWERLFTLQGLRYPENEAEVTDCNKLLSGYSAAALFDATARRSNAGFELRDEDVPAIVRLCHLVEGLPLAVELAAGWTNVLSIEAIVRGIEEKLSFLESDLKDLSDRHRSMEVVFELTWLRLSAREQALVSRLCVFRGGFDAAAAQEVAGASQRQLSVLANKALLTFDRKLERYRVHRLLRLFGSGKLAEDLAADAALRRRHCSFFATNLERWDRQLRGARQLAAVAQFDRDSANVSLAWQFAVENKQIAAIDMAADGLGRLYLWRRRFHEGEVAFDLAEQCLSHALAANPATGSEIKRIMAKICTWRSIYSEQSVAKELVKQVLQLLESPDLANSGILLEQAFALRRSGDLALSHDREQSRRHYKRSLAIYRELGDGWGAAKVLTALGWEAAHRGETERARLLGDEALALFDLAGDRKGIADSLWLLGTLAILEERVEKSTRLLEQSLEIRGTLGDRITDIAAGPLDLGMTLTWIGRMEAADAVREETLALYETQGKPAQIALAHVYLANSKFHIGQFAASEYHARIGLELCNRVGDKRGAGLALWILAVQSMVNQEVELTRSRLLESRECFQQIDSAPEIGWVYALLAKAALEVGQETEAKRYMVIALENVHGILGIITVLGCLVAYIHLLDVSGRLELGLEMVELMEKHPLARKSIGFEKVYGHHLSRFTQSLSQEAIANARRRGRARDLRATAEAIKAELKQSVTS